jgi:hypothetical protein
MDVTPEIEKRIAVRGFARDEVVFVCAVLVGTAGAVAVQQALLPVAGARLAGQMALAVATTLTAATHARLAHRKAIGPLVLQMTASAPLAYGTMRAVHALLGL